MEEITIKEKFYWWKVYRNGLTSVRHTKKKLSPIEALRYFKGSTGVIGFNEKP